MVHFFLAFFEQANHPLFRRLHHTLAFRNIINSRFVYRSPGQTDVRGVDWSRVSQQATVRCSARSQATRRCCDFARPFVSFLQANFDPKTQDQNRRLNSTPSIDALRVDGLRRGHCPRVAAVPARVTKAKRPRVVCRRVKESSIFGLSQDSR